MALSGIQGFREYDEEYFSYLREQEAELLPDPNYITTKQQGLRWSDRTDVVSWLIQVHHKLNFAPAILHLSVNVMDRFLSLKAISPPRIRLLAIGATLIAVKSHQSKIEYSVSELISLAPGGNVLLVELAILTQLDFMIAQPVHSVFLYRINEVDKFQGELRIIAFYLLEVALVDERFIGQLPSLTAATAYYTARVLLLGDIWTDEHVRCSGYTQSHVRSSKPVLLEHCRNAETHHPETLRWFSRFNSILFEKVKQKLQNLCL